MEALPVEMVGKIFSFAKSVRDVALASATCRKWREAARNHVEKLSFTVIDWGHVVEKWRDSSEASWSALELIIVETVMRTTNLKELRILCRNAEDQNSYRMHAGVVMACLHHLKPKLKAFTLTEPLIPHVNILERLADSRSALEHLEWHHAYIPTLRTSVGGFPSLVSLSIDNIVNKMSSQNFFLIFTVFPKLEHLSASRVLVEVPYRIMELNISTLKTLKMGRIVTEHPAILVLYESKLGTLCLQRICHGNLHWKCGEGSQSMQYLRLECLDVVYFRVGDCLGHLELEEVNMSLLEMKDNLHRLVIVDSIIEQLMMEQLDSLKELVLVNSTQDFYSWSLTCSQIVPKVGSRLCSLKVLAGMSGKQLINVDEVAVAFPCLCRFTLDYQVFYCVEMAVEPPLFKAMTHLELHAVMLLKKCASLSKWIRRLLLQCPNLKSMVILLRQVVTNMPFEGAKFLLDFYPDLIPITDLCPHINVSIEVIGANRKLQLVPLA